MDVHHKGIPKQMVLFIKLFLFLIYEDLFSQSAKFWAKFSRSVDLFGEDYDSGGESR